MKFTFKGGTHVKEYKNTQGCAIRPMPAPSVVTIPLSQHIGVPATPIVKVGDTVEIGQPIATAAEGKLSVAIHASVNGKVTAVTEKCVTVSTRK